ncbi:hypothetical protein LAZ67_2002285 [Cordylochernes scorpioides]|uniref:Uncharacterized protein n=1 Tax=Cordylochernes scorpioides TaxID=51811 RepID=A0ABY6K1Y2_9ARAC|nr:hypothetical protein LAZ67_2002285 [Cordylochernes scorpioides]
MWVTVGNEGHRFPHDDDLTFSCRRLWQMAPKCYASRSVARVESAPKPAGLVAAETCYHLEDTGTSGWRDEMLMLGKIEGRKEELKCAGWKGSRKLLGVTRRDDEGLDGIPPPLLQQQTLSVTNKMRCEWPTWDLRRAFRSWISALVEGGGGPSASSSPSWVVWRMALLYFTSSSSMARCESCSLSCISFSNFCRASWCCSFCSFCQVSRDSLISASFLKLGHMALVLQLFALSFVLPAQLGQSLPLLGRSLSLYLQVLLGVGHFLFQGLDAAELVGEWCKLSTLYTQDPGLGTFLKKILLQRPLILEKVLPTKLDE